MSLLIFLIGFSSYCFADSQGPHVFRGISYREYRGIKKISEHIMKNYPASQYHYVGVGASPTAIMAFIELTLGPQAVTQLPMSKIGENTAPANYEKFKSAEVQELITRHLEHFLPEERIGGKKVLMIDYAHRGSTLSSVKKMLDGFFQNRGTGTVVESLALVRNQTLEYALNHYGHGIYRLSYFMDNAFLGRVFDRYRKFSEFSPVHQNLERGYIPPRKIFEDFDPREYTRVLAEKIFVPRSYEHLLWELNRFMRSDALSLKTVANLVRGSRYQPRRSCRVFFQSL